MSSSRLRHNAANTQVIWLGLRQQFKKNTIQDATVISSTVGIVSSARSLGVVLGNQLSISSSQSRMRLATLSLAVEAVKTVIQASVPNRLDYCNSLYYGITSQLVQRLQSM
jgi:galactitol-specific phosphotransferase system IIC component